MACLLDQDTPQQDMSISQSQLDNLFRPKMPWIEKICMLVCSVYVRGIIAALKIDVATTYTEVLVSLQCAGQGFTICACLFKDPREKHVVVPPKIKKTKKQ